MARLERKAPRGGLRFTTKMHPHRLLECLGALHWSQRRLARILGRSESTVRQWVRGMVTIPADVAEWLEARTLHAEQTPYPGRSAPRTVGD